MSANTIRRRVPVTYDVSDPQQSINMANRFFQAQNYLECFDLVEQLIQANPQYGTSVLAKTFDWYKQINTGDRYSLYQSRVFNFDIPKGARVLDIGSGHLPFPFATDLADFAVEDNSYGRAGAPIKKLNGRDVYACNVEKMPFAENEFDFVNCSHVLEHTENPADACNELMRVAKRGYIETPTPAKDLWLNAAGISNHHWGVSEENGVLVFRQYSPKEMEGFGSAILQDMHCNPQTDREKAFAALIWLKSEQVNTMFMWEGSFEFRIHYLDGRVVSNAEQVQNIEPLPSQGEETVAAQNPAPSPLDLARKVATSIVSAPNKSLIESVMTNPVQPETLKLPIDPFPSTFAIETVLGCNLHCPECATGGNKIHRPKGAMNFETFKKAFDKIQPHCGYLFPHLWGEPTLNKDMTEIIRYASQFTKVNISTNAVRLTEVQMNDLITAGTADLIVSLDGITQDIYEQYRVGGDVYLALANLRRLQEINMNHGGKVHIMPQFIVFEHNQHEMELFKEFCKSIGLKPAFKAPYTRDGDRIHPTKVPQYRRPEYNSTPELLAAMKECGSPRNDMVILLDGTVVVCCHDFDGMSNMGNIFTQSIEEIWNSPKYRQFRHDVKSGRAPKYCQEYCMTYQLKK